MTEDGDETGRLALVAVVPTLELARLKRRVRFLEAALVQVLREDGHLREWFSAAELAALRLPGLPATRQGIGRMAKAQGWEARIVSGGRGGERQEFHFASLPRRAFEALIALVVREGSPAGAQAPTALPGFPEPEPPPAAPPAVATPQWVLPLLRLLRGRDMPLEEAVRALPAALPAGAACPALEEARTMLRAMGMGCGPAKAHPDGRACRSAPSSGMIPPSLTDRCDARPSPGACVSSWRSPIVPRHRGGVAAWGRRRPTRIGVPAQARPRRPCRSPSAQPRCRWRA